MQGGGIDKRFEAGELDRGQAHAVRETPISRWRNDTESGLAHQRGNSADVGKHIKTREYSGAPVLTGYGNLVATLAHPRLVKGEPYGMGEFPP